MTNNTRHIKRLNGNTTHDFYAGDNVTVMREHIADESVDLTVTSPPYDDMRTEGGFGQSIDAIIQQLWRITKEGGVVVWTKDSELDTRPSTLEKFTDFGWSMRNALIRSRNVNEYDGYDAPDVKWEKVFVFSKGRPKIYETPTKCKSSVESKKYDITPAEKLIIERILMWTNEGDTVLDIFGGSGATSKMAELSGRHSLYIDISEEYANDIAIPRLEQYL